MRNFKLLAAAAAALLAASPAATQTAAPGIEPARLTETVRTLTDDWFQGRAPGTLGEQRTVAYLIGRFQALGLEPGGPDGKWVQQVPLLHTRLAALRPALPPRLSEALEMAFRTLGDPAQPPPSACARP